MFATCDWGTSFSEKNLGGQCLRFAIGAPSTYDTCLRFAIWAAQFRTNLTWAALAICGFGQLIVQKQLRGTVLPICVLNN